MKPSRRSSRVLLAALASSGLLACDLAAQRRGSGLLDGIPMALSTRDGEPLPRAGSDLMQKGPGIRSIIPAPGNLGPRYGFLGTSEFHMFLNPLRQMVPLQGPAPDIDAFSMGLDWISANPDGTLYIDPSPGFWAAITFSVTRDTVGVGGPIRDEAALPGGAASDIFSYLWPGSQVGGGQPLDAPYLTQDAGEIDLFAGVPGQVIESDAMDGYLHLYRMFGHFPGMALPPPNAFFSVTDATKSLIPDSWVGGPAFAFLKSGATVFRMTVQEVPAGSGFWMWREPLVHFVPGDMGLAISEDLDALAYDPEQSYLLISTDHRIPGVPRRDPILFVNLLSDAVVPVPLRENNNPGEEVSEEVGLGDSPLPDDVDSICALDPRGGDRQRFPELLYTMMSSPRFHTSGQRSQLNAFHDEGPSVTFVARDLPTSGISGLMLSFQPSHLPVPNGLLLSPHLLFHVWQPLPPQLPQQLRVQFQLHDPQAHGMPVFFQNFSYHPSLSNPFSSSHIIDLYF